MRSPSSFPPSPSEKLTRREGNSHLPARYDLLRLPPRRGGQSELDGSDKRFLVARNPGQGASLFLFVPSLSLFPPFIQLTERSLSRADVFDIYLTRDSSRLFLIDLNPFSPRTDTLLFPPSSLLTLFSSSSPPELRVVESEKGGGMPRYAHNRYPRDVVELSEGQSVAEFAREWVGRVAEASVGASDSERDAEGAGKVERGERIGR